MHAPSADQFPAVDSSAQRRLEFDPYATFRRQELEFIRLNLAVIVSLVVIHLIFGPRIGYPSKIAFALLAFRFVEQLIEFRLLKRRTTPLSVRALRAYSWGSPVAGILFAFFLSVISGLEDAHYHVLMVVPIIAAGVRFPLRGVLAVVALAVTLTIMAVVLVNGDDNADAINELFEAVTIVLIYFVVGTVVWIMSEHVRKDSQELRRNYEQLTLIQSRLLKDERLAAVGRLAGAIAHEIRNPVAAISSSLAAAQGDSLPAAVRQEMWHIAAREASRLEKLTNDFLFYARARPLEPRPTDIADMMRYIADVIRAKASETAVAIHADCSPALRALVDDFQLHGALLNLALNAVEASSAGDSVDILAQLVGGEAEKSIEIDIRNSGSAIPAGVASRIFEPFVTTKAAGTGLGLAIAQNVARAHGGSLELTENRPGNVRFTLRIPYRACPAAIRESSAAPSQLPPDAARSLALAHNGEKN